MTRANYGLELQQVFGDVERAVGTYRWAVSQLIPDLTCAAWKDQEDKIFTMTRAQYEQAFGTNYRKPGFLARIVVAIFKVIPKFGPFKPLTPETERLFLGSFERSLARYRGSLDTIRAGRLALGDADLDTRRPPSLGANPLADENLRGIQREADDVALALPDPRRGPIAMPVEERTSDAVHAMQPGHLPPRRDRELVPIDAAQDAARHVFRPPGLRAGRDRARFCRLDQILRGELRRIGVGRVDNGDENGFLRELGAQHLGQPAKRELAGAVGCVPEDADDAGARGDEHHMAAAARASRGEPLAPRTACPNS